VIRMFGRILFSSYVYTNQQSHHESQPRHKEGSVTLEKKAPSDKRISKDEGEYVDYEEVK